MTHAYLTHCTRCQSRTVIETDGNGRLVERRNHVCTCPPVSYQPEASAGGQVGPRPAKREAKPKGRRCVDCGVPISGRAQRCPPHAEIRHRKVSAAYMRQRSRQRRAS